MSLSFQVLGGPGADNALYVQIDGGQSVERILFDCGEGCASALPASDLLNIDHLCFSHFHMDHVSGFDGFFRCVFDRTGRPNSLWGPAGSSAILQHRFQGFVWNLHEQMRAAWHVHELQPAKGANGLAGEVRTTRFELHEAFAVAHDEGARPWQGPILEGAGFTLEAAMMDHRTPSAAYLLREKPRRNIDPARMAELGLRPGPWLKQLKDPADAADHVLVDGTPRAKQDLLRGLLVETPGDSVAYLSDFLLDDAAQERLAGFLRGCGTIVCESQYLAGDIELARKHYHMTSVQAAELARRAGARELVLFHVSSRYDRSGWGALLAEALKVFPHTRFPDAWNLNEA